MVVGFGIKIFWPGLFITSPDHLDEMKSLYSLFHDPTMLRALGGKLSEENQYGGKRGGFASHHKLKMCQNKGR